MPIKDYPYQKDLHERGEAGYHDHGAVEAQGSAGLRADLIDAIQKCGVEHHQGERHIC